MFLLMLTWYGSPAKENVNENQWNLSRTRMTTYHYERSNWSVIYLCLFGFLVSLMIEPEEMETYTGANMRHN